MKKYLNIFISENNHKIKKEKFNFAFFFFGSRYFAYRKMYLYAVLYTVFDLTIAYIAFNQTNSASLTALVLAIWLATHLFFSTFFNTLYINKANKKIKQILEENIGTEKDIMHICHRKGGTNILAFILLIPELIIIFAAFSIFSIFGINLDSGIILDNFYTTEEVNFHGLLYDIDSRLGEGKTTVNRGEDGFEATTLTYTYNSLKEDCTIAISVDRRERDLSEFTIEELFELNEYTDTEWINNFLNKLDNPTTIKTKLTPEEIHYTTWLSFIAIQHKENGPGEISYLYTYKGMHNFFISYNHSGSDDKTDKDLICEKSYDNLIKTLKFDY